MFSLSLFLSLYFYLLVSAFFFFTVNVHITIYLHLLPYLLPSSHPPLSSTGRALFLFSADVVLLPVWAPERPVGSPSGGDGQGGARPGAVRDFAAAGAKICQGPSFVQETPANQVLILHHSDLSDSFETHSL